MIDHDAVGHFWEVARVAGKVNRLEVVLGRFGVDSVPPPAWSFGADRVEADHLVAALLAGRKTATTSLYSEYQSTPANLPQVGDLSIVLDGAGVPRALVRTTAVAVAAFHDVDAAYALADGAADLASWREQQSAIVAACSPGVDLTPHTPVVLERLGLVHPRRSGRDAEAPVAVR